MSLDLFAVFHAVRGAPERRNVVRSYSGFFDAMKLIVGARLRLRALGVDQEPPPGTLMPTPTRIRSEARDENQSPIHLPTQSCSLGTLLHRSNRFSTFVNLILICDCDGQPATLDVSRSNPRRINRLKVSVPPRYLEKPGIEQLSIPRK
jgi:hypothetical protein